MYCFGHTNFSSRSGSLKVLECVSRLCQLSSGRLSWRSSSCLGVSKTRVQEDRVFWKPLQHVRQPHNAPTQHPACSSEPPHVWPDEPGDTERANAQAQPHPHHSAAPCMQHAASCAQELVNPYSPFGHSDDSWSSQFNCPYSPNKQGSLNKDCYNWISLKCLVQCMSTLIHWINTNMFGLLFAFSQKNAAYMSCVFISITARV